jgi:hypothetical protein
MNRRQFLATAGCGRLALTAGCSSIFEEPGAFRFGITNWRERAWAAEATLHRSDEELLDGRFHIAANDRDGGDPPHVYVRKLAEVTNGDVIDATVRLDGEEYRGRYEVTCNERDGAENNFFLYIHSGDDGEIEFGGSECGA